MSDIKLRGDAVRHFEEFPDELPDIMNWITSEVALSVSDYYKSKELSGQVLNRVTGQTYRSTKFYKKSDMKFGIRPGVGVPGNLNYLNKWVGTSRQVGVKTYKTWKGQKRASKLASKLLDRTLKNKGMA